MKSIKTVFIALLLMTGGIAMAQTKSQIEGDLHADFVSSYIWRGLQLGRVSFQPEMSVEWKGLSLSAWGSVGLGLTRMTSVISITKRARQDMLSKVSLDTTSVLYQLHGRLFSQVLTIKRKTTSVPSVLTSNWKLHSVLPLAIGRLQQVSYLGSLIITKPRDSA